MVDMISEMPGYEAVQRWFVQVIPALSKYISLDNTLKTTARFKVLSPTNSLSIEDDPTALHYLGFTNGETITPRLQGRRDTFQTFWQRIDIDHSQVIFGPATYRAPVIQGFSKNVSGRVDGDVVAFGMATTRML